MTKSGYRHKSKKTILHVIDALNHGGAQNLLVLLAKWTPDQYSTIVCSFQQATDVKPLIQKHGVPVYSLELARPSILFFHRFLRYLLSNILEIGRICRKEKVKILHCHLSDAEFIGITAGIIFGIPKIVTTVHYPDLLPERGQKDPRNFLRIFFTRLLYKRVDRVIAVSKDVASRLKLVFSLPEQKISVVINRIDTDAFCNLEPPDLLTYLGIRERIPLIITVGRLMPPKGHSYLLEAAAILKRRSLDFRILFVGDGDLRPALENQAMAVKVEDRVKFLGSRTDIPQLLAGSDIFVLPSLWEGTSLALLEAAAAGKPIVCTDIPGNRALFTHLKDCYMVPAKDPEAIAKGILFFLSNPGKAAECGKKARILAQKAYDIRQTVRELQSIWESP